MRSLLLPVASGLLLALSFPPFPSGPLPFVALVPFAVWTLERSPGREGALEALRGGVCLGAGFFALLLHWIAFAFPGRWGLGAAALVAMVGVLALFPALAAWLIHRGVHGARAPLWLVVPVAWTATEWLRGNLPGGFAFPWGGLALTFAGSPRALALAEWTGEHGVALWIVVVNGLIAEAVVRWRRRHMPALPALAALTVAALPVAVAPWFAAPAADPAAAGRALRVAVVQTAVSAETRRDAEAGAEAMAAALERLLPALAPGSVDLVVLPETAYPVALEASSARRHLEALQHHSARLGAPLLVGALGLSDHFDAALAIGARGGVGNSIFVVDAGGIRGRYDKRQLVPGVERVPLVPSSLLAAIGDTAAYAPGARQPPLRIDVAGVEVLLGALVCYESAFASLARQQRRAGAHLLVNVTNDGWFGGGFPGAAARAQHAAHLVLRAVENRTWVVRSANGGVSMVVDPSGRVRAVAPAGVEGVSVEVVRLTRARAKNP